MPDGPLSAAATAVAESTSVVLFLDTALGTAVGGGMNSAIVAFMSGQGTPESVVEALTQLAS
jgi:hypothetical protein